VLEHRGEHLVKATLLRQQVLLLDDRVVGVVQGLPDRGEVAENLSQVGDNGGQEDAALRVNRDDIRDNEAGGGVRQVEINPLNG